MDTQDDRVEARLREASEMTEGLAEVFDGWAEDLLAWRDAGLTHAEIDDRLLDELAERGFSAETLAEDLPEWIAEQIPEEHHVDFMRAYKLPEWFAYAMRTYALTGQMAPMYPFLGGGVFTQEFRLDEEDEPVELVWVLATPSSDVKALANELKATARQVFGKEALRPTDNKMLQDAQFARLHRLGFSYREIAVKFLQAKYMHRGQAGKANEILRQEDRHRSEIEREKDRVRKAIKRAQRRWKDRGLPDSTPD